MTAQDYLKAALQGDLETVRACLEAGIDVNTPSPRGLSALMLCGNMEERLDVAHFLLGRGIDLRLREPKNGWRAFHFAAINGHAALLECLIEHGDGYGPKDWKALMFSVTYRNHATAERVLQLGAEVDMRDEKQRSPLMRAAQNSDHEMVRLLLRHKADPDLQDGEGRTALMIACGRARLESVQALLEAGADRELKDRSGRTALDIAREKKRRKFIDLL